MEREAMSDEVKLLPCEFTRKPVETPEEAAKVVTWAADAATGKGLHGVASELGFVLAYLTRAIEATRPTDMEVRDAE